MSRGFLVKTSFVLILLAMIFKLLGFARDQIIAVIFGAGPLTDAYYVALTFPRALESIIGGTFATALVPVLADLWQDHRAAGWRTARDAGTFYLALVCGVAVAAALATGWIVAHILAPGLPASTRPFAIQLTRAFSVGFLFWATASAAAGILNSRRAFIPPATGPLALNVTILLAIALAGRRFGISALAIGTVLGMIMQLAVQTPFLVRAWVREGHGPDSVPPASARVWALAGPLFILALFDQAPAVVDNAIASGLATGSISILTFARKLMQLPVGLFVGAVSTVFYTSFSEAWAKKDARSAADELGLALGVALLLAVPAAVGLAEVSGPVVQFVFQHGRFDAAAAGMTAHALVYFCIGLPFVAVNLVLLSNAYAAQDVLSPLRGYAAALAVNALGDWELSRIMGPAGIALASSLAAITLAAFLVMSWEGSFRIAVSRALFGSLGSVLIGSVLMGMLILLLAPSVTDRPVWIRLAIPGTLGLATYVLSLLVSRPRELRLLMERIRYSGEA